VPNLDVAVYNKDENKIARFPLVSLRNSARYNLWNKRNIAMQQLKEIFNRYELRNGQDYVFLQLDNGQELPVMFADENHVSFFMLAYECQKNP
jgi:hypothetical protein